MGVYFDYFRAADDEAPSPHLEQLVTLTPGVPFDSRPKSTL